MKVSQLIILAGARRSKIEYSKDLPHYRMLQVARAGLLVGLLAFVGVFIIGGPAKNILLVCSGILLFASSILYRVVTFSREERLRHG